MMSITNVIKMKKYKVTLWLMIDPTKNDKTFRQVYIVDAENEYKAYLKAQTEQDNDIEEIKYRSVFNYDVEELIA